MRDLAFQINSTWEGGGEDGTEIGHRLQETFRGYVGLFKELEVPEASDCKLVFVRYDVGWCSMRELPPLLDDQYLKGSVEATGVAGFVKPGGNNHNVGS